MTSRRSFLKNSAILATVGAISGVLGANVKTAKAEIKDMPTLKAIMTRRSVRSYTDQKISQEQIETLLKAAMQAPSAGDDQPWEFLVVTDKDKMLEVTKVKKAVFMAKDAPLGILTCINTNYEKLKGFAEQSVCCATQNILLAAHAMGLGAVWTSAYPNEDFVAGYRKVFNLPENIIPVAFVVIGYPKSEPKQKDTFKPERVHTNTWN